MSEFKVLIQETKSSLLDLEVLLLRAKSLATLPSERMAPSREAVQSHLDAIIKAIEERVLQEYLRLSQQQVLETQGVALPDEHSA